MEKIETDIDFPHRVSRKERRQAKERLHRKKIRKTIRTIILTFVIVIFSFIGLIRAGIFSDLQEFLVTSAMTTMSHKYIANIFASDNQIKNIMENNKVIEDYEKFDESKITEDGKLDKVEIKGISKDGYTGYMLIVSNPKRVFLGTSSNLGEYGTKISQLAEDYDAIAGINAGGFSDENGTGKGGTPTGIIIEDGIVKYIEKGSNKFNIIGFNNKDMLIIGQYTLDEIKRLKIRDAIDFRPFLIVNGKPTKMYGNGGWGTAPRTAIGQRADGTVLFVIIDGRQVHSAGATMKQLQDIMIENKAVNAANLDGGSSSVMYFEGEIVNSPSSVYGDRYLPSAFLVNGDGLTSENIINNLNN